jgi:GLPGLI family protein
MKLFFISLATLLIISTSQAQEASVSQSELCYWKVQRLPNGAFTKQKMLLVFDEQHSIEQITYVIPPGAEDKSQTGEQRETVINEKGESVGKISFAGGPTEAKAIENAYSVYKDFKRKSLWASQVFAKGGGNQNTEYYTIKDPLYNFTWRITEERKSIGAYECIKAVSQPFRGRVYEAWFAPSIPISDGPWKLCGLPGLILEAADQSGEVAFVFESLALNQVQAKPIENYLEAQRRKVISWEDYKKMVKDRDTQRHKAVMAKGVQILKYGKYELESTD